MQGKRLSNSIALYHRVNSLGLPNLAAAPVKFGCQRAGCQQILPLLVEMLKDDTDNQ